MSALSRVNPKLFIIPERTEQVPTARAVQPFVRIIPPQTDGLDCAVRIFALPGPVDQKDLWVSEDIQLSSILAEKLLEGFAFHPAAVSSVSGTVSVGNVPQAWDIPMLGIDFQLTEAGCSGLSKDNFNEVASALAEGLRSFKDERAWSRSSSVVPPQNVYFDSGLASFGKQDYDKAISDFTEAIRLDPSCARAYYNRGLAYEQKDNLDKAFSDYNEAIRLDPNFALAYMNRGNLYLHTGNRAKANADFATERRLKSSQSDRQAVYHLT
jgi:tetratricopeptide (TPR) repeat protein